MGIITALAIGAGALAAGAGIASQVSQSQAAKKASKQQSALQQSILQGGRAQQDAQAEAAAIKRRDQLRARYGREQTVLAGASEQKKSVLGG